LFNIPQTKLEDIISPMRSGLEGKNRPREIKIEGETLPYRSVLDSPSLKKFENRSVLDSPYLKKIELQMPNW